MNNSKGAVARFFDEDSSDYLAHKYDSKGFSYMSQRKERAGRIVAREIHPLTDEHFQFLDAGCGPGILLDTLAQRTLNYWGLDISAEMLALAQQQLAKPDLLSINGHLLKGDIEALPFASSFFDAAASLGVIEYLSDDDRFIAEMVRVVKPGGLLIVAITNRYSYNLLLERITDWLRRRPRMAMVLSAVKVRLGLGPFRQMDFVKRRHSVGQFLQRLRDNGVEPIHQESWGLNLLPYPLNYLVGARPNLASNRLQERANSRVLDLISEGCLIVGRVSK